MISAIIASLLVFVPLADIYGRKIVNLSLGAGQIALVSILVASSRYADLQRPDLLVFVICTVIGLCAARSVVTIVYATELSMKYFTSLIVVACFAFFSIKGVLTAVHAHFSHDMMSHVYLNLAINALTLPLQA